MSGLIERQHYTFGNDKFCLEDAYHDCKLVFDGITDDDSFQEADEGLILYYANEIIYALQKALEGKDANSPSSYSESPNNKSCNQLVTDCISRQAAIRWVKTECNPYGKPTLEFESGKKVIEHLEQMPSAQLDSKTAHWVPLDERFASWSSYYKCSECGFRINLRTVTDFSGQSVDYCPHCGLRMEAENETN